MNPNTLRGNRKNTGLNIEGKNAATAAKGTESIMIVPTT